MKQQKTHSKVIAKNVPTCFVLMSTFQLMCAYEAIQEFEIKDYKLIFSPWKAYHTRNKQMCDFAEKLGLKYEVVYYDDIDITDFYAHKGRFASKLSSVYERVFIGDYYAEGCIALSSCYASENAEIAFLDDGNSSIALFYDVHKAPIPSDWIGMLKYYRDVYRKEQIKRKVLAQELNHYSIVLTNEFYTIFSDIKTRKYILHSNSLTHIVNKTIQRNDYKWKVYIIGTVISQYAQQNGVSENIMEGIIWTILSRG